MNTSRVSDFAFTSTRRQNAFKEEEKEHDYQVLPEIRSRFKEKEETNTYEVHNFELKGINKPSNYENPNIGLVQHNSQIGFNSYINGSEEIHAPRNYAYLNNFKSKFAIFIFSLFYLSAFKIQLLTLNYSI